MKPSGASFSKRLSFRAISLLSLLLLLFLLYFVAFKITVWNSDGYRTFRSKPTSTDTLFPKLSQEQIVQLGWAHTNDTTAFSMESGCPKSSYVNFPVEKPAGKIRVGVFGCSNAEGYESGYGLDFPSQLQRKLENNGYTHFEVINFGTVGYGMHQSHLLYESLGKKYDLDIVVVNLFWYHIHRDNTFRYYNTYGPIHARYILENDQLTLIEVPGKSRKEAAKKYHRFFQPKRYRKYDVQVPNYLKPLAPLYKTNPNYYRKNQSQDDETEEVGETYNRIIESFAANSKQAFVLHYDDQLPYGELALSAPSNVCFYHSQVNIPADESHTLYQAPQGHFSPMGNQFIADELFNLLTGASDSLKYVVFEETETAQETSYAPSGDKDFDSIQLKVGTVPYPVLFTKSGNDNFLMHSKKLELNSEAHKSLMFCSNKLSSLYFYASPQAIAPNSLFSMEIETANGSTHRYLIGRALQQGEYSPLLRLGIWLPQNQLNNNFRLSYLEQAETVFECLEIESTVEVKAARFYLEAQPMAVHCEVVTHKPGVFRLKLAEEKSQVFKAFTHEHQHFQLGADSLKRGEVVMTGYQNGGSSDFPFLGWHIKKLPFKTDRILPFP